MASSVTGVQVSSLIHKKIVTSGQHHFQFITEFHQVLQIKSVGKCLLCSNKSERSFHPTNAVRVVYRAMSCGSGTGGSGASIAIGHIRVTHQGYKRITAQIVVCNVSRIELSACLQLIVHSFSDM